MKLSQLFIGLISIFTLQCTAESANGTRHNCDVRNGDVYCWGANTHGQLGSEEGSSRDAKNPAKVNLGMNIKALSVKVGQESTCALLNVVDAKGTVTAPGKVKCWGGNMYQQLGIGQGGIRGGFPGSMGDKLPFVNFGENEVGTTLAVGADHACVSLKSGGVKCWGHNDVKQLGVGHNNDIGSNPKDMGDKLKKVESIADKEVSAVRSAPDANANCAYLKAESKWTCWGNAQDFQKIDQTKPTDN